MEAEAEYFYDDGETPNNSLPVLIYRKAVTALDPAEYFKSRFEENAWAGVWEDSIFDYNHFHSNAHEALGIASGKGRVLLGGEQGQSFDLEGGDMLILPAGTGHKLITASGDFTVVGAYPAGQEAYDICKDMKEDPDIPGRIEKVALPELDPLYGRSGPLRHHWK